MQISSFDRISNPISCRFLLLFLLLTKNNWAAGFEKYLRRNCISLQFNCRLSNSQAFLLPQGLGNVRNPIFGSLGFWGTIFFSSGFLEVLRKQYFHDFVCMKGKIGHRVQKFEVQVKLIYGSDKNDSIEGFLGVHF